MTDADEARSDPGRRDRRECEVCGALVPAASYREHLLKECPGGSR